ncbi:MAG: RES domain-containing protein [Terriglobia bacterium]
MIVWRICLREHARQAFRGEGARLYGGRWNPPGLAIVLFRTRPPFVYVTRHIISLTDTLACVMVS